jgi:ribosomal protein S18 acetylase RimI-like enzyme
MPVPDHVHRFWMALDERIGQVQPTWWGAVVTDERFPAVWDINYARIDVPAPDLTLGEVAEALLPALNDAGTDVFHVVSFHPEETTGLLVELSTRGHVLTWDTVMDLVNEPSIPVVDHVIEELNGGPELWSRVEASLALFEVHADVSDQLRTLEEVSFGIGGKRWFGVRDDDGLLVSLAALITLEGVGYLDNVATFPQARGRGLATALAVRAIAEARAAGAQHVCLFADPDDVAIVKMYERIGFREVGRLAATRGPAGDLTTRDRPRRLPDQER